MEKPITNLKVYDLEESLVCSGYAMIDEYNSKQAINQGHKLLN